ncbi:MAG: hypothetical protein BJBARM5_0326 [Candidatus Parvarchaeum acidophilus ARMAN-5]|uniref:Uncharacterized protein n=1 Tax=Candidatus Parvarchaeum acidophilus ARMAN-5 TaxID=662762 RepID=D6GV25_PARA5|nr:MAG: hypothetical protein BJBARM5_0326 [Candidatus Parvarchaeum acidophilus ARMAN-5]
MVKRTLEEVLIENTIDNNPSILHKLMQISSYSYIENNRDNIMYADGEYPLYIHSNVKRPAKNRYGKRRSDTERWNADLAIVYKENERKICEIVEIETIRADRLLEHRKKHIIKKIKTVERAYKSRDINGIFADVDEIRFSLSLNAVNLNKYSRYKTARNISQKINCERNKGYKEEKLSLYRIYMLKEELFSYCRDSDEKNLLMNFNTTMPKNIWKKPIKKIMTELYYDLKDSKNTDNLYEYRPFNR